MDVLIPLLTIFMLAVFVGFEIITKVPPLLHTPLMSGSNAISGITIIGALLSVASDNETARILGFVALVIATINVVGGFLVGVSENLAGTYLIGTELKLSFALVLIITVLLIRPAGIFGRVVVNRV